MSKTVVSIVAATISFILFLASCSQRVEVKGIAAQCYNKGENPAEEVRVTIGVGIRVLQENSRYNDMSGFVIKEEEYKEWVGNIKRAATKNDIEKMNRRFNSVVQMALRQGIEGMCRKGTAKYWLKAERSVEYESEMLTEDGNKIEIDLYFDEVNVIPQEIREWLFP